jgi:hypothetical protein
MVTSWSNSERICRSRVSRFNEINGRHEETRTPDLYRVNRLLLNTFNILTGLLGTAKYL